MIVASARAAAASALAAEASASMPTGPTQSSARKTFGQPESVGFGRPAVDEFRAQLDGNG